MPMAPTAGRSGVLLILALLTLSACSRLALFDTLVPKDGGVALIAKDVAYGPDPRQKLDIYRPANAGGNMPVIVFVYGGSWNSGRRQDYSFAARSFASQGFVTVVPDYRLVPQIRYPDFVRDTAKAISWTYRNIEASGGDRRKLFVVGHSAGAYNVMMVALDPAFLAREGLPPSVIDVAVGLSGPYDFLPLDVDATREAFKGVADLRKTQPVYWARRGRKLPVFIATGDEDDLVLPRNSVALAAALRKSGNPAEEKHYPGLGHAGTLVSISRPLRGRAPVLADIVAFLRRH